MPFFYCVFRFTYLWLIWHDVIVNNAVLINNVLCEDATFSTGKMQKAICTIIWRSLSTLLLLAMLTGSILIEKYTSRAITNFDVHFSSQNDTLCCYILITDLKKNDYTSYKLQKVINHQWLHIWNRSMFSYLALVQQ